MLLEVTMPVPIVPADGKLEELAEVGLEETTSPTQVATTPT